MLLLNSTLQVSGRMHGRGMKPDVPLDQDQYRGPRPVYPGMGMGMRMANPMGMGMGMPNPMGMGPMNMPTMAMGPMGMPMPLIPGQRSSLCHCKCMTLQLFEHRS